MTIQQIQEQRNALLTQMQALATGDKFDAEKRSQFDAMNVDVTNLEGDLSRLQAIEKIEAEQRSAPRIPRSQPGAAIESDNASAEERSAKEKRAFEQYIRYGTNGVDAEHRSHLRESRDITTAGTGANGAALVPQQFNPVLIQALKYYGPTADLVGQRRTNNNGAPLKIALSNDIANSLVTLGEATAAAETDPTFTSYILSTDTITTGIVKVSRQELNDSYFNVDSFIRDSFGLRYGRGMEAYVTNGNGSNIASLLSSVANPVTATGSGKTGATGANSFGYEDLVTLYGNLDNAYVVGANWLMTSKTRAYLMGVTDTLGDPILQKNPQTGALDSLWGRPIVINEAMPQIGASATSVLFGDLSQAYLLRTDGDLLIARTDDRYWDTLEVGFIGYLRAGGIATNAGGNPLTGLVQAAS